MGSSGAVTLVRRGHVVAGAVVLGGFVLADPAAAQSSVESAAVIYTDMSAGRLGAMTGAMLGLIGVVIGALALARPEGRFGTGNGRSGATVALTAGLIAVVLGGWISATADGGLGTGNGLGGAVVALVVGLVAMVLGGLALAHSGRAAQRG
jgi:hypothetical protein